MTTLFVIALGGASGAVLRFLVSNGIYHWLGREFPYGTLTVNIVGSFLMGLLSVSLTIEKFGLNSEYKAAILVGFLGAFTTFATFSLDTYLLIEQQQFTKAILNIIGNIFACISAVWVGLLIGKLLFLNQNGWLHTQKLALPYGLIIINALVAFLIGLIGVLLLSKSTLSLEHQATLSLIIIGIFITLSSVYLILSVFANGYTLTNHMQQIAQIFAINIFGSSSCLILSYMFAIHIK